MARSVSATRGARRRRVRNRRRRGRSGTAPPTPQTAPDRRGPAGQEKGRLVAGPANRRLRARPGNALYRMAGRIGRRRLRVRTESVGVVGVGILAPLLVEMVEGGGPARQAGPSAALLLLVDDRGECVALGEGQQCLLGCADELLQIPCVRRTLASNKGGCRATQGVDVRSRPSMNRV